MNYNSEAVVQATTAAAAANQAADHCKALPFQNLFRLCFN